MIPQEIPEYVFDKNTMNNYSNILESGKRVWCEHGMNCRSPNGSVIHVPPKTGGIVDHLNSAGSFGTGSTLYNIVWGSGDRTCNYFSELLCIHPFKTLDNFLDAIQSASRAHINLGPKGGFRQFELAMLTDSGELVVLLFDKGKHFFYRDIIKPRLDIFGIALTESWLEAER